MSTTSKVFWFFAVCGFISIVLNPENSKPLSEGNWQKIGYSSYTECKNSPEVNLKTAQMMMQYQATSASQIKHIICN